MAYAGFKSDLYQDARVGENAGSAQLRLIAADISVAMIAMVSGVGSRLPSMFQSVQDDLK